MNYESPAWMLGPVWSLSVSGLGEERLVGKALGFFGSSVIEKQGVKIRKGQIQDATFVHADPGKTNSGMEGRGSEAKTSRQKDASWTKKGKKSIFGYKAHV